MRHLIFREAMQSTTLGHAIGSFCVRLLSMSCQIVVCFNRKGSFISIINTRYAYNATSERGTQTGIDPATFEDKCRSHSATTRPELKCINCVGVIVEMPQTKLVLGSWFGKGKTEDTPTGWLDKKDLSVSR